ncbi:MAG: hypothetical protein HY670_03575 [Chloroflexi bacterium]|nr:hypothetical protein [Chloroflexota bacterium]
MKNTRVIRIISFLLIVLATLSGTVATQGNTEVLSPSDIQITVTINGLEEGDVATLTLSSDTLAADKGSLVQKSVDGHGHPIIVEISAVLPDDNYLLLLEAAEKYFRDPKGYLFTVYDSQILNPAGTPVIFDLIPPSARNYEPYRESDTSGQNTEGKRYRLEGIISLSAPPKQPPPQEGILDSTGYHYAGPNTSQDNEGVWGRFTVVDPGVRHNISPNLEFVADRVMATSLIGGYMKWIEVGWAEVSWRDDTRYMYEYDTARNEWYLYSLPTGTTLEVAVLRDPGTTKWYAEYQSGGNWYEVAYQDIGISVAENGYNCSEVFTYDGTHPDFPSTYTDYGLLYVSGQWDWWDTSYSTNTYNDSPYDTHYTTQYYDFYVHKH